MRTSGTQALLTLGAALVCVLFTGCGGTAPMNESGGSPAPGTVGSDVLRDASGAPSGVNLFWPYEPGPLVAGYHIYRSDQPITDSARGVTAMWVEYMGSRLIAVPPGTPAFVSVQLLYPVAVGETWYFRVTAVDAGGSESYLSAETSVTIANHVVTGIDPASTAVGFNVGIDGERFGIYDSQTDHVFFPGVQWQDGVGFIPAQIEGMVASWYYQEPAHITAAVPLGATTGQLDVSVAGVSALSPDVFTNSDPYLTAIAPLSGTPRGFITLTGANFGDAADGTHRVVLDGKELLAVNDYVSYADTEIVFVIPGLVPGNYPLTVRVDDTDSNQGWLVVQPSLGPVWEHTWGNVGNDVAAGIAADSTGNVFLTGSSDGYSIAPDDVLLMRYTSGGQLQWGRYWDNTRDETGSDLAIDDDDDVYITGSALNAAGVDTVLLLKFRNTGQLEYGRTWEDAMGNPVVGRALVCDGTTVYIAATLTAPDNQLLLLRCSLDGTFDIALNWPVPRECWPTDIAIDNSGDLVVIGSTSNAFGASGSDIFVLKVDTDFTRLWARFYGSMADDLALGVTIDAANNILMAGGSSDPGPNRVPILVQYDTDGKLVDQNRWPVVFDSHFMKVFPVGSGHYLAVGASGPAAPGVSITVLNTDLSVLGSQYYSAVGGGSPIGFSCGLDGLDNLLVCGSDAFRSGTWAELLLTTSLFGGMEAGEVTNLQLVVGNPMAVTGTNRPAVGTVDTGGGLTDTLAIKYDPE